MGNRYNNHHTIHHQNLHRTTFLPMLCSKSSIKDVKLPKHGDHRSFFNNDPLSPKVGFMGQVKRNTKFNTAAASKFNTAAASKFNINIRLFFSTKNLIIPTTISITTTTTSRRSSNTSTSCDCQLDRNSKFSFDHTINVADLDPPLPVVIKKKAVQSRDDVPDGEILWKRRRDTCVDAFKTLHIQPIQIPNQFHHQKISV